MQVKTRTIVDLPLKVEQYVVVRAIYDDVRRKEGRGEPQCYATVTQINDKLKMRFKWPGDIAYIHELCKQLQSRGYLTSVPVGVGKAHEVGYRVSKNGVTALLRTLATLGELSKVA